MKVFKLILVFLVSIIVLVLVVALFVPREYRVERDVSIQATKADIFQFLRYLRNQEQFTVWAKMDPNMKREYRGTDGTVGFVSAWESENKNVGSGEQEIIGIIEGERIDYELRFFEPFETVGKAYFITEAIDSASTRVTWGFKGKSPYPWNVMLLVMNMDDMLGNDLEQGLENLKALMEKPQ